MNLTHLRKLAQEIRDARVNPTFGTVELYEFFDERIDQLAEALERALDALLKAAEQRNRWIKIAQLNDMSCPSKTVMDVKISAEINEAAQELAKILEGE